MSNHEDIRKLLSAYCGDDLGSAERVRIEEHLAGCAACRAELADLQTALRLIRTTPEAEPPAWLAKRIMARVRDQQREKRSWLQRIFFPLHVKLPIEAAALLLVCVSGYYLARNVETELNQQSSQKEIPTAAPETGKPAEAPQREVPAAVPSTPAPPPAARKELRPEETAPASPSAPKGADQVVPQHVPESPGKPSPQPVFAPARPAMQEERVAPPAEAPSGVFPYLPDYGVKSAKQAKKAGAEMKKETTVDGERGMLTFEAPRGAAGAPAGAAPPVPIRLEMTAPASAHSSLRDAVTRSGGVVIDDSRIRPRAIKARIPSVRMGELLEQLGRLGRVVERPQTPDLPGMVEIEISW